MSYEYIFASHDKSAWALGDSTPDEEDGKKSNGCRLKMCWPKYQDQPQLPPYMNDVGWKNYLLQVESLKSQRADQYNFLNQIQLGHSILFELPSFPNTPPFE